MKKREDAKVATGGIFFKGSDVTAPLCVVGALAIAGSLFTLSWHKTEIYVFFKSFVQNLF